MLSELFLFLMCNGTTSNCPNGAMFRWFAPKEKLFGNILLVLYKPNIIFRKEGIKKIYIQPMMVNGFFVCYV